MPDVAHSDALDPSDSVAGGRTGLTGALRMRGLVAIGKTEQPQRFASKVLAAILAGVLFWIAQLTGAWGLAGWICIAPLLWAIGDARPVQAALLGFLTGMVAFGLAGEWALLFGMHAWLALASAMSLYLAGFAGIVAFVRRSTALALIWTAPAAWILMDWTRTRFPLGGIGLAQLGYSQVDLVWGQLAVWGGGILVSGLLLAANGALAELALARRDDSRGRTRVLISTGAIMFLVASGAALALLGETTSPAGEMNIAVVQPYDVNRGLDAAEERENLVLQRLEADSIRLGDGNDLIVWPEASLRATVPETDLATFEAVTRTGQATGSWILANGQPLGSDGDSFVNRNYLFDPSGALVAASDKEKLVPFGEYVPWRGFWSGWVSSIERVPLDAVPGEYETFHVPKGALGTVICFESTSSGPVMRSVQDGANVVIVQTNNRSFEWSSLSRQHVTASRMRAIESGRPVIHAAISGITAFISPDGSVLAETALFERTSISKGVELRTGLTPYARRGDGPLVLASAIAICIAIAGATRRSKSARHIQPAKSRAIDD